MRAKRQNIQLELALEPEAKGEARSAGAQGTEARLARAAPERPAAGQGPSMETVVEPGNLKKALARVRRNKGAPGIDGMSVDELGNHLKDHWSETNYRQPIDLTTCSVTFPMQITTILSGSSARTGAIT